MKILITGAGGFVGSRLAEHFSNRNEIVALRHCDLDISDRGRVLERTETECPDIIFNCAVLGIDACEADPAKALALNVEGPANLARAAKRVGAEIVHFSTNYVFDGERRDGFYTIDDDPRPVNEYGRTKLNGEQAVTAECDKSFIVRISWVFGGSRYSFFDKAISSLRRGHRVAAVADNWACVTFVGDLAERLSRIIEYGRYGTYHVVNSGICSKYEFAVEAARLLVKDCEPVTPVKSTQSLSVARPRYTPMACKSSEQLGLEPLGNWKHALQAYLDPYVDGT